MDACSRVDYSSTFELRPLQSEGYKAPGPGNVRARREGGCTVQGEGGVGQCNHHSGVEPSPCFSNFLARTTFVLESLPEAKNPGQDAIFGDFVFTSSNS